MALLTRESIQQKSNLPMVEVNVDEWGEINPETGKPTPTSVFVREMSARERDDWEESNVLRKGKKTETNFRNMRARLAIATCCDADGNLIFKPEDVDFLSAKPVKVLERICKAALKINGITTEEEEEELVGN
jgi:translation initiation factor 2 beta subunit (eIF-2beta)/eIF-5